MKKAAFLFFRVEVGNAACAVQYLVVVQTMLVRCPKNLDFTVFQKVSLSNLIFSKTKFPEMLKDIENGLINCVITKDLSRLGRNYLDCGLYLEVFFPEHNVRYIAVNDGVDTLNKSAMDITPFRNILNEMYSADVSVKIKSAYRARFQQGKFMGRQHHMDMSKTLLTIIIY